MPATRGVRIAAKNLRREGSVQVGVQIGLDDIEKITRRRTSFREGKHAPRHPWWWVWGGFESSACGIVRFLLGLD
jgi:hypothetical protein